MQINPYNFIDSTIVQHLHFSQVYLHRIDKKWFSHITVLLENCFKMAKIMSQEYLLMRQNFF